MIMQFLGRFYTLADSRQCIYAPGLKELLCLAGSFHSLHIITYLDNTANTPLFMPYSFSSVGLKQIQLSLDTVFSCSVMTSQQNVAVCLLCRLLAQFLVDQGPQLLQILSGNNKPELYWKEHRCGQAPSFSHIISGFRLKLIKSLMNPGSLEVQGKDPTYTFILPVMAARL